MARGAVQIQWIDGNTCLYKSGEYFDPVQLADMPHVIPAADGGWRKVLSVEKTDENITEEWPHIYRVTVAPLPQEPGNLTMLGVG